MLETGKPAWIVGVAQDPNFVRAEAAQHCGLQTAYAFPVLAGAEVVATLEFFTEEASEPEPILLQLMSQVGVQLGRVIERQRAEDRLLHAASHDALTSLPNRTLFLDRLGQSIARLQRDPESGFAVLFIDLDHFKLVNDSLGHSAGDQLLVEVAGCLGASLRQEDFFVRVGGAAAGEADTGAATLARLGGDEFTVLLSRIRDPSDAMRVAERPQQSLQHPFTVEGYEVYTSASIGIATSGAHYTSGDEMLRDADLAMYRAKAAGKARSVLFDEAMHLCAMERLRLESDLRRALANQEFVLHYQPIVSLRTGALSGFEALIRWQDSERGLIPPGEFIPIAEDTGLIVFIGSWVLREACRTLRQWQADFPRDPPLMMSVNISARQFAQPDIVSQVRKIIGETGISPETLRLEITESATMGNAERAVRVLSELKGLGLQISVDDFGTGFSSLSYLHRLPVDVLKIDRSFVSDMDRCAESKQIVDTILGLARNLGLSVIAEGAEAKAQVAQLALMGCDYGQGYFFSKPLDGAATRAALEAVPCPEIAVPAQRARSAFLCVAEQQIAGP